MRHAYYIAHLDETLGDAEYIEGLKEIYLSYFAECFTVNSQGEREPFCTRYCGVSRYETPNGVKTVIVCKDFFNDKPTAFYTHVHAQEK